MSQITIKDVLTALTEASLDLNLDIPAAQLYELAQKIMELVPEVENKKSTEEILQDIKTIFKKVLNKRNKKVEGGLEMFKKIKDKINELTTEINESIVDDPEQFMAGLTVEDYFKIVEERYDISLEKLSGKWNPPQRIEERREMYKKNPKCFLLVKKTITGKEDPLYPVCPKGETTPTCLGAIRAQMRAVMVANNPDIDEDNRRDAVRVAKKAHSLALKICPKDVDVPDLPENLGVAKKGKK